MGDGLRTGIFVGDGVGVVASSSVDVLVGTTVTYCCGDADGAVGDLYEVGLFVGEGVGYSVC